MSDTSVNKFFGQIRGPFTKDQEIIELIRTMTNYRNLSYLKKLGIQTDVRNEIEINGHIFEIGKTGILESDYDNKITSLKFKQDVDEYTIVDFICNK